MHDSTSGSRTETGLAAPYDQRLTRSPSAAPEPARRILLAEDSRVSQLVATAMLEHLGFQVDLVTDGAEAVKAATLTPYRAILMDCQIPVLDGYEATSEIRRLQGVSRRTPIIAVTASSTRSDREHCLAAGMDDHLVKPFGLKALAAVLERWAPEGSEPARPVLDAQVVDRLTRLGEAVGQDLMGQLATLFLADDDARVVELRQLVAADDAPAVGRWAHSLSGASANLGATGLASLCAKLERDSAAGGVAVDGGLLEAVEAELERVRSTLGLLTPTP